ncbi:DinB family protein [Allohahella sp. A8]|uniref:DinB family protein n=1 Tax=Allohahella sp. A8 TaxID=3141461 RepID=UPI003A8096E8
MVDTNGVTPGLLVNQFRYKAWANAEILSLIDQIAFDGFPEQWTTAVRLLNHTFVVDQIFAAHLQGRGHAFVSTNTVATPTLKNLRADIQASDEWFVAYVGDLRQSHCVRYWLSSSQTVRAGR